MKKIFPSDFPRLLAGSTFFGTGGGGNPLEAKKTYARLTENSASVALKSLEDFLETDLIITIFGVGSVTTNEDPEQPLKIAITELEKELKQPIAGIIPVEIGPAALARVLDLCWRTNIPMVDGDVVGGRATPEVFLETITLFDQSRSPSVIAAKNGQFALLSGSNTPQTEEKFFRNFAKANGDRAFVAGYPMRVQEMKKSITQGTVSRTLEAGTEIQAGTVDSYVQAQGGKKLFSGNISSIQELDEGGFTKRMVQFKGAGSTAQLFIKNENLIFWINDQVVLTCPDCIMLTSQANQPLYNATLEIGMEVQVYGFPAVPLWRTATGRELFQPKLFGFNLPVTLL